MNDFDNTEDEGFRWVFGCTDEDGGHTSASFKAMTWTTALSKFICFLRGVGYVVPEDAIAINVEHASGDDWWGETFTLESEEGIALVPQFSHKYKVD